jgi:Tfp pilus assembly protein PilW
MDCKVTSTKRRTGERTGGFSLVESWVTIAITSLMMVAVASFGLYTGKSFAGLGNYVDLETKSQHALDTMTKAIRQTQQVTSISTNQLVFLDWDGNSLTYTYNPSAKTLSQIKNGLTTVLLTGCSYLCFSNFQRTPVGGTYDQYPVTTSPADTKLVSVTWICGRSILGSAMNSESVQTAKIVIRKQ